MNKKFFQLPIKKQQQIINAAYKIFSQYSYKEAPMLKIAEAVEISKSLLFHYFINKKELYLYLCKQAKELTDASIKLPQETESINLFETMIQTLQAKCYLMHKFPYICAFSLRAYYEQNPDIKAIFLSVLGNDRKETTCSTLEKIDKSKLRPDIDINTMYYEIELACEGYLYRMYRNSKIDISQIEKDFKILITHWKATYERRNAK